MISKFQFLFFILIFFFSNCATNKKEKIDYSRIVRNNTFSDVHRNPKVIGNEYFEFENTTFSYYLVRKPFKDAYFRRLAFEGIFVILDDTVLLTIQKMLYCDKEVIGQNLPTEKGADPDKCTYSYYDIKLLRSKGLIDNHDLKMPTRFQIVKTANSSKIIALNKNKGAIYENKKPLK